MKNRLMGLETEYGCCFLPSLREEENGKMACLLVNGSVVQPDTQGVNTGFLTNGARFYCDQTHDEKSLKLEYATPECSDPFTLACCHYAGDRVIARRIQKLADDGVKISVFRHNTDSSQGTWGCHENYLVDVRTFDFTSSEKWATAQEIALASFLAVRQIICGSGLIRPHYLISQRSNAIQSLKAECAMHCRPMLMYRPDPFTPVQNGCQRLQVVCGDSNVSSWQTVVKVGLTSLVIELIEFGETFDDDFLLDDPVNECRRLRHFGNWCVRNVRGRKISSIDAILYIVDLIEGFDSLPDWSQWILSEVRLACKLLQDKERWYELADRIDWIAKLWLVKSQCLAFDSKEAMALELDYHNIENSSLLHDWLLFPFLSEEQISYFVDNPPAGRPTARAQAIHDFERIKKEGGDNISIGWAGIMRGNLMVNPFGFD